MPVYSMTGYASAQRSASSPTLEAEQRPSNNTRLGLEIRSVNSRFLDLSFRLPDELRSAEPAMRAALTAQLKRGKVEVRATLETDDNAGLQELPVRTLQRLNSMQDTVKAWLPQAAPLSVADVLRWCNQTTTTRHDWSDTLPQLLQDTLTELVSARAREGARLSIMLLDRIAQLRALAQQAQPLIPQLVAQQSQRFMERWKEALQLADSTIAPEAARDRALHEATAFAIRIDVAEELTRLASHLDELERLLTQGGDIGKRLDFLIQELHREANTMGSKSAALELTRISVDMKVLIEQMREQVQNIE